MHQTARKMPVFSLAFAFGIISTAIAAPAAAVAVDFTAARQHVNILNPPNTGRCAPTYLATVNINPGPGVPSSTGNSNLGAFQSTQSHCIISTPPTPFVDGLFSYAFDLGDVLEGTYFGDVTATGTANFFDAISYLTVTGGTGRFLGASGALTETGSFLRGPNPEGPGTVTTFSGTVSGRLALPAVPEPASWAMMIAGFGAVGMAARRRRPHAIAR